MALREQEPCQAMICTDFILCTVLNWLITIQLRTRVIESHATAYPTLQLHIPTFRLEKAVKNDVMTTAYHDVMTTHFINIPAPTP